MTPTGDSGTGLADASEVAVDLPPPPPDEGPIEVDVAPPPDPDPGPASQDAPPNLVDTPDSAPDAAPPPDSGLVVLSLNLHCLRLDGTPYTTNAERLQAVAALALAEAVDVIAVQEACKRPNEDAMALLGAALGAEWSSEWALAHVAWEGTADEADEGVGLLARGGLHDAVVIEHAAQSGLTRVALCALTTDQVRVCSVHFDHQDAAARRAQAREIAVAALVDSDPARDVVVAGDFNAKESSPTHQALLDFGYLDASGSLSDGRIDHVMVHRGASLAPDEAALVLEAPAVSDHPGVLARLAPAAPQALVVTRVTATVELKPKDWLAVRGDTAPLTWEQGWPMRRVAPSVWRALITEWDAGSVELKVLRNDEDWMTGPNAVGQGGGELELTPTW